MKANIQKWGNSLGIRIPQHIAQKLYLHQGSVVEISTEDDHIALYPKRYNLANMLDQITGSNKHDTQLEDSSKGKEEW